MTNVKCDLGKNLTGKLERNLRKLTSFPVKNVSYFIRKLSYLNLKMKSGAR